ncbi:hypothetical protein EK21DRAFT_73708, partial [Setomelanomma holmii]
MAFTPAAGHPPIPGHIPANELVAIVTVHHARGQEVNKDIAHHTEPVYADGIRRTRQALNGVHVYLRRVDGQKCFLVGKETTDNERKKVWFEPRDVFLPGPNIGPRHIYLLPIWESDCWRFQSVSEILAYVDGVPIQNYTLRTKKNKVNYPQAIHLAQSRVNRIVINGLRFDIWIMNTVRTLYTPAEIIPAALHAEIQDVAHRPEDWARTRYHMKEPVSPKSHRVLERFTGEAQTVKLFRHADGGQQRRNQEFLMFSKQEVESSIVRYLQSIDVNTIPAIVTTTYADFMKYGALRDDIHKSHPGFRFSIAGTLARRLFSALAFLHYHGIVHGHVSGDSVVLHLEDNKAEDVLLVDYTTARPFMPGAPVPRDDLIADGEATMKLVEDCCDLWALRNGQTPDAEGEYRMEQITKEAMETHHAIQRCAADYFVRESKSKISTTGKKLKKLLEKSGYTWQSARANQEHNLKRKKILLVGITKLNEMKAEWSKTREPARIGEEQYMLLTLGHAYLDSLADPLYLDKWELMPHEICARIKELGGDLEHSWQTFQLKTTVSLRHTEAGFDEQDLLTWLALSAEIHPEWREAIEAACTLNLNPQDGVIAREDIYALHNDLEYRGRLPTITIAMFDRIHNMDNMPNQIEETYRIWYHVPSRMFNLTQLQRLATPDRLVAAINKAGVRCDNFVEVRGDPKIQGNYAPLSLLTAFANALGVVVAQVPDLAPALPTFDPSDFSQISQGRMVLARPGMLGYGSMVRTGDQCSFLAAPKDSKLFETPSTFIPTYFGDMKVLPKLPDGIRNHDRPEHWSKFKTAEEIEASADLSKRNILPAKAPSALERERVRAKARPPTKRSTDGFSLRPATPDPKRPRSSRSKTVSPRPTRALPDISMSFVQRMEERAQAAPQSRRPGSGYPTLLSQPPSRDTDKPDSSFVRRNADLLSSPPRDPSDFERSFTVADGKEILAEDWKKVNKLLKHMSADDDDDQPDMQGLMFGFEHHEDVED